MKVLLFAFCICFSGFSSVYAFDIPVKPFGFVNDYAELLKPDEKQFLEQELSQFAASTTNEIAVVTIPNLGGDTIEHYAVKLFEAWKIGKEKQDNGVLFLIARDDRKVRIEVGYGLEGALPDSLAGRIITDQVTPAFKNNEFGKGVLQGVTGIIQATQNEYVGNPPSDENPSNGFFIWMFVILQGFAFLGAILGRSKSWWLGGVLGGVGGAGLTATHIFGLTLFSGGIVTSVLVGSGLLFDYLVSKRYTSAITSGSSIPWWIGGGKSSGSSSSTFGGFGGGSSGGGGASGNW